MLVAFWGQPASCSGVKWIQKAPHIIQDLLSIHPFWLPNIHIKKLWKVYKPFLSWWPKTKKAAGHLWFCSGQPPCLSRLSWSQFCWAKRRRIAQIHRSLLTMHGSQTRSGTEAPGSKCSSFDGSKLFLMVSSCVSSFQDYEIKIEKSIETYEKSPGNLVMSRRWN